MVQDQVTSMCILVSEVRQPSSDNGTRQPVPLEYHRPFDTRPSWRMPSVKVTKSDEVCNLATLEAIFTAA